MNIGSKVICINDTIDADKIEEIKKILRTGLKKIQFTQLGLF